MTMPVLALAVTLTMASPTAAAAQPADRADRWAPWLGCWELIDESVESGAAGVARLMGVEAPRSTRNAGGLVCVTPAAGGGATFETIVNDQPALTETIVADGRQAPLTEAGCRGWQRAEWSPLGARLYASAEIACHDQAPRRVSGMAIMIAGPRWIDIQMVESEGRKSLRVRRYRRAADQSRAAAGAPSSSSMPLGLAFSASDVIEASGKVAPEALEAALVELRGGFDLDGRRLLDLADAGVPPSVIDLMVALTFPERFVVESRGGGGSMGGYWPTVYDPFAINYPYYYTSYYAPFGYRYWGGYNAAYFGGPGFVVVGQDAPSGIEPSGTGRVVDGRGYTRVRRHTPDPAMPRGIGGGSSTASEGGSSSGGDRGVSGSGYSGGSSGAGSGRTAQPRPPGGR